MTRRSRTPRLSQASFLKAASAHHILDNLDNQTENPLTQVTPDHSTASTIAIVPTAEVIELGSPDPGGSGVAPLRAALARYGPSIDKLILHFTELLKAERWTNGRDPMRTEDNATRSDAGKVMLELYRSAGLLPPLRTAQSSSQPKVSVSFQLPGGTMKVEVGGDPAD